MQIARAWPIDPFGLRDMFSERWQPTVSTGIICLKQPSVQSDLTDLSQNQLTLEAAILDTVVELRGPSFEATKWRRNRRTPREDWTVTFNTDCANVAGSTHVQSGAGAEGSRMSTHSNDSLLT